jgi:HD domain
VTGIARARLTQERWFALIRLLLIEAFLFQAQLEPDLGRLFGTRQSVLLFGFGVYALIVVFGVAVRRTWPAAFAYATATIDLIAAIVVTSIWQDGLVNPGLAAVAASGIAAGVRRFPLFETFIFSFFIAAGFPIARFALTFSVPASFLDVAVIVSAALLPVLARASTLAPQLGVAEETMDRLADRALTTLASLSEKRSTGRDAGLYDAAEALSQHTRSQVAGVLIKNADDTIQSLTVVGDSRTADRLPPQLADQLAARLLALTEPRVLGRADNLSTRGLPDQYPPQLNSMIACPVPDISPAGAVLFAANPEGGPYTPNDRLLVAALAREAARLIVAATLAQTSAETRLASTEALLVALEARRPGSRHDGEECARISVAIARQMGWSEPGLEEIRLAALLHNVGQLGLPDALMDKTDGLSTEEGTHRRQHPLIAARMIDSFNRSEVVLNAVYSHRERWDGKGYPSGLAKEEIPQEARIVGLADAIVSMLRATEDHEAVSPTDALQEVIRGAGTQFDPAVVQAFVAVLRVEGQGFLSPGGEPVQAAAEAPPVS